MNIQITKFENWSKNILVHKTITKILVCDQKWPKIAIVQKQRQRFGSSSARHTWRFCCSAAEKAALLQRRLRQTMAA